MIAKALTARVFGFQFGTATDTFLRNVPVPPVDFATLGIEIQKAPAILRGRFHLLTAFSLTEL
jgi:hypothetical protein